ncbi:MAG TPA: RyR domain-containing protein [Pyrinomonadaceae bacterium]|nr:RyR domain-containing protein [Pyrinomonadaceae bacterium]
MELPDIEVVAGKVHEAWMEGKRAQGVTSRKSETGEEMMVPYDELSEECKEIDRVTVRAVYEAVREAMSEEAAAGDGAS